MADCSGKRQGNTAVCRSFLDMDVFSWCHTPPFVSFSFALSRLLAQSAPHIQHFWKVLEGFTQEQLRRFVLFAYAQSRLPATDEEFDR